MTGSVIAPLIFKDWRLQRACILWSVVGAVAALGLVQVKKEVPVVLGAVCFFIALILLACFLPQSNVLNERKKQNLAFMMSLPVSAMQYSVAKIVSTFGMFLVPWIALLAAALSMIVAIGVPHGFIPILLVLAGLTLVGFAVMTSAAIISESEGWYQATVVISNSSYGIGWYLIARVPSVQHQMGGPRAVWSPLMLILLGAEFAIVALSLGLTLFLQSRKRDFV